MAQVEFLLDNIKTIIQCNENEKMKDIIKKFTLKLGKDLNNVNFLYNGNQLNIELTIEQIASNLDKERKTLTILVNEEKINITSNLKKSKNIICPNCYENIRMNIKNYKISLYDCKNKHRKHNILFNEFENTQYIDESKIKCEICKNADKSSSYKNKFFICLTCKINICPLCKSIHNKNHDIIDYEQKYFICNLHNENYISYCEDCKFDICLECEKNHKGHILISYGEIVPNKVEIEEELNIFKNKINDFKNDIKQNINEIITKSNNLMKNLDIYYNIYENMINNYSKKNRNYPILQNINDINDSNKKFIEKISQIMNNENIIDKFNDIIDIYNQMINSDNAQYKKEKISDNNIKEEKKIENENNISEKNNNIVIKDNNYIIPSKDDKIFNKIQKLQSLIKYGYNLKELCKKVKYIIL